MQHYRDAQYPIEEIRKKTSELAVLAQRKALDGEYKEACKLLKQAEAIEVDPHRVKNLYLMRLDWEERINLRL